MARRNTTLSNTKEAVVEKATDNNEIVETPEITGAKKAKSEKVEKKKSFVSTDGILCRSVTPGSLFVDGPKSGMMYTFAAYGDEAEIEYRDLKGLIMMKSQHVFAPRFVIEDKDFIAEVPQLDQFYSKQFSTKDLRKILDLPLEEMIETIKELPSGAQQNMKIIYATAVDNGTLDSVKKIKALDKLWGTQLDAFSEE